MKLKTDSVLHNLCKERGITLAEVSRRSGISRAWLHEASVNGGLGRMASDKLQALALAMDVTAEELIGKQRLTYHPKVSPILRQYAEGNTITDREFEMLSYINYRGRYPQTIEDYWFIHEAIKSRLR